jgi:hypothetical protein
MQTLHLLVLWNALTASPVVLHMGSQVLSARQTQIYFQLPVPESHIFDDRAGLFRGTALSSLPSHCLSQDLRPEGQKVS